MAESPGSAKPGEQRSALGSPCPGGEGEGTNDSWEK